MTRFTAAPLAAALTLSLGAGIANADNDRLWSAADGQAWTTGYGDCWLSAGGPTDLPPCVVPALPAEISVTVDFMFDKYDIDSVVNPVTLRQIDDYIARAQETEAQEMITIVGHTDARGSDAYNMKLGMRRAETIRDYFVSKGYPESLMGTVESVGKRDLIPGVDPYSVEQRRVVIMSEAM